MKLYKQLLQYTQYMRLYIAVIGGVSLLTGLFIIAQAHYLSQIINDVFLAHQSLKQVALLLGLLLGIVLGRSALIWGSEFIANKIACMVKRDLRRRLLSHLFLLGPEYMKDERSGELVNTLSEGVESLDAYFLQFFPQLCATLIIPLAILVAVFTTDVISGVILLVTMPLLPLFMALIGKQASAMTQRRWHLLSLMSAHFLDVLQGLTTLKLFGRNQAQQATIRQMSERFGDITMNVLRVAFLSSLVLEMGATISTALIAVEIGLRLLYGQMPFMQAFFVLLLAPEFYQPLRSLGTQFHASMSSTAGAQRIFALLETPVRKAEDAHISPDTLACQELHFKHVCFTYMHKEQQQQILKDVSFTLQKGEKVALVGPSGAGKSTIAHLLLRFLEPEQGEICCDNTPIQTLTAQNWRKLVAWQPQQPYLFNTTIAENIRIGRPEATMEEIAQAARQAHIHEFIQSLPQGYETVVGEHGTRLSGGQIQRLSLARALIKNAPVFVLDESTSTLDAESEEQVLQTIDTLAKDRMLLIIAHRLNTIKTADQILVLQDGQIVERGTHAELSERQGVYRDLLHAYEGEEVLV